jgi:hypothetical protein
MILSKIGITESSDKEIPHGKFGEKRSSPLIAGPFSEVLKSICSRMVDPLSGSSPAPVIFSQPLSFNTFNVLAASIDMRILEISLSVISDARSLPMSVKSSVSDSKHAGRDNAEAMIARDEFGRYPPTKRKIDSGRLMIDKQLPSDVVLPQLRPLPMIRIASIVSSPTDSTAW